MHKTDIELAEIARLRLDNLFRDIKELNDRGYLVAFSVYRNSDQKCINDIEFSDSWNINLGLKISKTQKVVI